MTSDVKDGPAIDTPDYAPETQPTDRIETVLTAVHDVASSARDSVGDAYEAARDAVTDGYASARDKASAAYGGVAERIAPTIGAARESVSQAYDAARDRSATALANARGTVSQVKEKGVQGIEENPLAAIIGGIAIGAAIGALVPRSRREAELLAPLGEKLNDAAHGAYAAAKTAGIAKLDELGLNRDVALDGVRKIIENATEAARAAGQAASSSVGGGTRG